MIQLVILTVFQPLFKTDLIALDFDPQRCVSQADLITYSRAKHSNIGIATDVSVLGRLWRAGLGDMTEALLHQVAHNILRPQHIDDPTSEPVATGDDLCARNRAECHRLRVSRLESDCGTRCDVKSLAIGLCTVED